LNNAVLPQLGTPTSAMRSGEVVTAASKIPAFLPGTLYRLYGLLTGSRARCRSGDGGLRAPGLELRASDRSLPGPLHAHGGRFHAAQRERRSADAHREWIAAEPHARDDFAAGARDEAEIAQSGQQGLVFLRVRARQCRAVQARNTGAVSALQVSQGQG